MMSLLLGSVSAQAMLHVAAFQFATQQTTYVVGGIAAKNTENTAQQTAYVVSGRGVKNTLSSHEQTAYVVTT